MSLTIEDDVKPQAVVVRLAGRLDTATAKTFEDHLGALLARGQNRLLIDLGGVDYISSYGLRVFLLMAKKLRADRNGFALCSLTPEVKKIFQISGFDKILTIRGSAADHLAVLGGASG